MAGRLPSEGNDDLDQQHEINITPFIDVMLVLLIIFMVAAPLSTVDIPVVLPAATAQPKQRPDKPIFVTIDARNAWSVGETAITPDGLIGAIDALTSGKRDTTLFLRGDKTVDYGEVLGLLDRLRAAGYLKVGLVGLEARASAQ
jgi:biopolymer transport protein ExbD